MVWSELGTVTPELMNWHRFNTLVSGGILFRVRQSWVGDWPGTGSLLFSSVYSGGGRYGFRRVGSDTEDRIINMPVPEAHIDAGLTDRHLEVKLTYNARIYASANWQVSLDQWIN